MQQFELDPECQSALEERIQYLHQTKPEILNASGAIDQFGFLSESLSLKSQCDMDLFPKNIPEPQLNASQILEKEAKWDAVLKDYNEEKKLPRSLTEQMKELCRGGVPEQHRGLVWQIATNSVNLYQVNEKKGHSKYCELLKQKIPEKAILQINKDIDRTQPCLRFFRKEDQLRSLFRLLKAYAAYNPTVEYCQGMGFPASVLLYYMPEQQAYWAFYQLMARSQSMYKDNLSGTAKRAQVLFKLLQKTDLKIAKFLTAIGCEMQMFSTPWFMGLYLNTFPFNVSLRIFDSFLCEGEKVLYRAGIALFRTACRGKTIRIKAKFGSQEYESAFEQAEKGDKGVNLLCMSQSAALIFVQHLGQYIKDPDVFMDEMLKVKFSTEEMRKLEREAGLDE